MSLSFPLQASQDAPVGVVTAGEEADEDEEGEEDAVTVVVEAEREEQGQTQNKGEPRGAAEEQQLPKAGKAAAGEQTQGGQGKGAGGAVGSGESTEKDTGEASVLPATDAPPMLEDDEEGSNTITHSGSVQGGIGRGEEEEEEEDGMP